MRLKLISFLFTVCLLTCKANANDTLTVRQVYNFSVGDTFDYEYIIEDGDAGPNGTINKSYQRMVVQQISYSTQQDTIYYGFSFAPFYSGIQKWDTITDLDSLAVFQIKFDTTDFTCEGQYSFDTSTYSGYESNTLNIFCFEQDTIYRFTQGLGRTEYHWCIPDFNGAPADCYTEELVYFSNGTTHVGTPYFLLEGVGIKEVSLPVQIELAPNPTEDNCILRLNNNSESVSASVLDITGREVVSLFLNKQTSSYSFDTKDMSPGVYLVQVTDLQGRRNIVRLVKQ
jgi:hypothetical protein